VAAVGATSRRHRPGDFFLPYASLRQTGKGAGFDRASQLPSWNVPVQAGSTVLIVDAKPLIAVPVERHRRPGGSPARSSARARA
jgi:hypothetical protein